MYEYWNCGSGLIKKLHIIKDLVEKDKPDAFFVSESDVLSDRVLSVFRINGYTFENSGTIITRGKSRLSCWYNTKNLVRVANLEKINNEIIVLKDVKNGKLIIGLYQPFKCFGDETFRSNFIRLLENLEEIMRGGNQVIIVGDFNVPYDCTVNACPLRLKLEEWSNVHILDQLVSDHTRARWVANDLQSSLLDLVFTNVRDLKVEQVFNAASDHNVIKVIYQRESKDERSTRKILRYLDWSKYDGRKMCERFVSHFEGFNANLRDPNSINESITNAICKSLNELVPKRSNKIAGGNYVISPKILNLKNKKSRLFKKWKRTKSQDDHARLKNVSKELNKEILKQRSRSITKDLNGDAKRYWGAINKLCGKGKEGEGIDEIVVENRAIKSEFEIANAFVKFFCCKVENLCQDSEIDQFVLPDLVGNMGTGEMWNEGLFISRQEVEKAIDSLKTKKAQGVDEIPGNCAKDLKNVIALPLTWLFNSVIETGKIPEPWRISRIVPVLKKGDKKCIGNYRPVSNTSTLSKILERCLINKLVGFFDYDKLMGDHQHAYRPGRSTTTAALTLQDHVACILDEAGKAVVYSTDLTAAFDLLRPNLLVKILLELQVPKIYIRLILDFLSDRQGFVDINGTFGHVKDIPLGCVQGSVLGPFLFNIYTGGLSNLIKCIDPRFLVTAYADDVYVTIPFDPDTDLNVIKMVTENVFNTHTKWLKSLGMVCNFSKTDITIFGFNGPGVSMTLNGTDVIVKDTIRILGLMFEKNLRWGPQVAQMLKKANSSSYSLRQLNRFLSRKQHREAILAFFISHVAYGVQVWGDGTSAIDLRRIDTMLFKVMRQHWGDYRRTLSNWEICTRTRLRNFNSLKRVANAVMLHKLVTEPDHNKHLTERLIMQSTFSSRHTDQLRFFDFSTRRAGKSSFINRVKELNEVMPPRWFDMSSVQLKLKMKETTPYLLQS